MKNVKLEFNTFELIEIKKALKGSAREHFLDNIDGKRSNLKYNINCIEKIMLIYDKVCEAYNQSLEEK